MKIEIETRLCTNPGDFVGPDGKRLLGLVYFQKVDAKLIPRVITDQTDKTRLQHDIRQQHIYLPTEKVTAELS